MHLIVLIVEILAETRCWDILNLALEDLRDWIAHLLQDVKEEHQFVLTLLAVGHVLIELIDGQL